MRNSGQLLPRDRETVCAAPGTGRNPMSLEGQFPPLSSRPRQVRLSSETHRRSSPGGPAALALGRQRAVAPSHGGGECRNKGEDYRFREKNAPDIADSVRNG